MKASRGHDITFAVLLGLLVLVGSALAHSAKINSALASAAQQCAARINNQASAKIRLAERVASFSSKRSATSVWNAVSQVDTSTCTADAEVTEGPYYIRNEFRRNDIRDGEPGVPLILDLNVIDVSNCSYVPYASVELWHCNSTGSYAGFTGMDPDTGSMKAGAVCLNGSPSSSSPSTPSPVSSPPLNSGGPGSMPPRSGGGPGGPGGGGSGGGSTTCMTDYSTFLRGYQITNDLGNVQMTTIYPGFYVGRTPHIHIMIRTTDETVRHIGQLFFDDTTTTSVFQIGAYADHIAKVGDTWIRTSADGIYQGTNGQGTLSLVALDESDLTQGLIGAVNIYIDSTATRSVSSTVSVSPQIAQPPSAPYTVISITPSSTPSVASSPSSSSSPTSSSAPSSDEPTSPPVDASTTPSSSSASRILISSLVVLVFIAVCALLLWDRQNSVAPEPQTKPASVDDKDELRLETIN